MLKLGWGKEDITPIGEICEKVSLLGQFYERITDVVRDPIYATALAIESAEGVKTAIVSLDLSIVPQRLMSEARKKVKILAPDFPSDALIMAATHVHTGPHIEADFLSDVWGSRFALPNHPGVLTAEAFLDFVAEKVAIAVSKAWESRATGGVGIAFGRVAVPQSRRVCYKDGSVRMYGTTSTEDFLRIEGGADTGVEYLVTYDANQKLSGLVINLACPAQILEHESYISADLWGEVRRQWPECPYILPLCGAAGDIAMRDLVRQGKSELDMHCEKGMMRQANQIVRESQYVISEIFSEDILDDTPVRHERRIISLPLRRVSDEEYNAAKAIYDAFEREYEVNDFSKDYEDGIKLRMQDRTFYARAAGIVNRYQLQAEVNVVEMEIHALRLGEMALVTNPFELYQDYAMQIKARSPARQTMIAQLSCGSFVYLPTELGIKGGSYSTYVSDGFIGPEGGQLLVEKTLDMLQNLYPV